MMHWYILKCIPNRQRAAANDVAKVGDAYYPTEERTVRNSSGRALRSMRVASMPGYVFARLSGVPWSVLRMSPALTGVLTTGDRFAAPALLSNDDIAALRASCAASAGPSGRGFRRGDAIRIAAGPFIGWESRVTEISRMMVTCKVMQFDKMHEVDMPVHYVERVA
jgi:transcription antitermination factor NusG